MLSLMLAGITGVFRNPPGSRRISQRVAGFLCATVITVGTIFGAAWGIACDAAGPCRATSRGQLQHSPLSHLFLSLPDRR